MNIVSLAKNEPSVDSKNLQVADPLKVILRAFGRRRKRMSNGWKGRKSTYQKNRSKDRRNYNRHRDALTRAKFSSSFGCVNGRATWYDLPLNWLFGPFSLMSIITFPAQNLILKFQFSSFLTSMSYLWAFDLGNRLFDHCRMQFLSYTTSLLSLNTPHNIDDHRKIHNCLLRCLRNDWTLRRIFNSKYHVLGLSTVRVCL